MTVYTTGDSHAQWTYNCIPGVKVHSISMLTMQRIGHMEDTLIPEAVAAMGLTPSDVLILAAGEIDCRSHVKPRLEHLPVTLEELLHGWVDAYLNRIATLPTNGARVAVTSVPPPIPEGKIYHAGVLLPVAGSNAERVEYVKTCNRMLCAGCAARGLLYIDIYTPHADVDGLLRPDVSDGSVHIRDTARVVETLHTLGILPA